MTQDYTFFPDLANQLPELPPESILSRSLLNASEVKVTLFRFAPGQELTEHTAASPAILHFIAGKAALTLGGDEKNAQPGSWVYMPARLPHALVAKTEVVMLLLLLTGSSEG